MQTKSFSHSFQQVGTLSFWVITLALLSGLILSLLSWIELCVEHCSANKDYRLFGWRFGPVGLAFFSLTLFLHLFSSQFFLSSSFQLHPGRMDDSKASTLLPYIQDATGTRIHLLTGWMIAGALGAEVMFITIQKYQIGHWCPVCLGIACCLAIAGLCYPLYSYTWLNHSIKNRGAIMGTIRRKLTSVSFFILGFLIAFIGVTKSDPLQAEINTIKNRLVFGNQNSPIEVYFATDWFCPSCKKVEPQIEKILPQIQAKAAFYFIDYPIHTKSVNFSSYNVAFLLTNKPQYLKARTMLMNLTDKTETPKDPDVIQAAEEAGIHYKEVTFLEIKSGMDYFESIVNKYHLSATPTVIITNTKTNKSIKFEGRDEISPEKILNAIDKLNKAS